MKALTAWSEDAMALSAAAFRQRHPEPFLVWLTVQGPDLKKHDAVFTMDRLVLDNAPKAESTNLIETYFAAAIRTSNDRATVSLGCGAECDIRVNDASVSRKHAELVISPTGVRVRDASSFAGTYVNDGSPTEAPLESGDRVTIGNVDLLFLDSSALYQLIRRLESF